MSHRYSREAVDRAINSERRAGKKVSRREARLIHSILQGPTYRPFGNWKEKP